MARIETSDLIEGSSYTSNISDGDTAVRAFMVTEIRANGDAVLIEATRTSGIPRTGDAHPTLGDNVQVTDVTAQKIASDNKKAKVFVTYKTLKLGQSSPNEAAQTQISVSASTQSVDTNKFFKTNGTEDIILLKYKYPAGKAPDGVQEVEQVGIVTKQVPLIVARFSRQETDLPLAKILKFQGKVNASNFGGGKKRTWLCTDISTNSEDNGQTFSISYEFTYNSDTWDPLVVFIDPDSDRPPTDVLSQSDAAKRFKIYETANFNALNLIARR